MPALAEVDEAVKRVCVNAVTIDTSQSTPFIVGDFNGDGSEDLAVIVRPAPGALPRLNSEYANWISEDPRKVVLPRSQQSGAAITQGGAAGDISGKRSFIIDPPWISTDGLASSVRASDLHAQECCW
jgi:hypothetical protein